MKIGIVGNYGNHNHGDESVLEGIIVQLENTFQIRRKDILVFTNSPEQTNQRYGTETAPLFIDRGPDVLKFMRTLWHHRRIIASLDFLIIGGGGILMDLYRSNPFVFGIYGLLVKWKRLPAAIFGAGAGPIDTFLGKRFIKMIGNAVNIITVRDQRSKQLLEDIGVKTSVNVILDPAFYLPFDRRKQAHAKPIKIGVTALPYYHESYWPTKDHDKYNAYIQGMAANLDLILDHHPDGSIQFFGTKHPLDTDATKDIQHLMKHQAQTNVYDEELDHQDIIDLIAKQDLVIGTRLHSLILSIVAKTPVIAVGYHNKVLDVMRTVGNEANTLTISQVSEDHQGISNIYDNMNHNWEATLNQFAHMDERLIEESPDGMAMLKDSLYNNNVSLYH